MSELWVAIMEWVAAQQPGLLSDIEGLWKGQTDEWDVEVNGHDETIDSVPRFGASLIHRQYLAFGIVGPGGGVISGPGEDEIIAHFNKATAELQA